MAYMSYGLLCYPLAIYCGVHCMGMLCVGCV